MVHFFPASRRHARGYSLAPKRGAPILKLKASQNHHAYTHCMFVNV